MSSHAAAWPTIVTSTATMLTFLLALPRELSSACTSHIGSSAADLDAVSAGHGATSSLCLLSLPDLEMRSEMLSEMRSADELRPRPELSPLVYLIKCGQRSAGGQWSVVSGQWSVVSGQWSVLRIPTHSAVAAKVVIGDLAAACETLGDLRVPRVHSWCGMPRGMLCSCYGHSMRGPCVALPASSAVVVRKCVPQIVVCDVMMLCAHRPHH